jgi:hypothetical protein
LFKSSQKVFQKVIKIVKKNQKFRRTWKKKKNEKYGEEEELEEEEDWYFLDQVPNTSHLVNFLYVVDLDQRFCWITNIHTTKFGLGNI